MQYMILIMFCPECRAEYRPGFARCSDCDVDLVHEIPERDIHVPKWKRDSATTFPTFRGHDEQGAICLLMLVPPCPVTAFTWTFEVLPPDSANLPFQSVRRFSHPLATFALRVSIGQTKKLIVPVQPYKIIDDPPVVL